MRHLFASAAFLALSAGTALAAEPIGDWLVKDGYANIRIDICNGKLWGIVAWEKEAGVDKENPDPAKKTRATLGMPVLMGLAHAKPNRWEGEIYNSNNGKMYTANVSLADENTLDVEGCLIWPACRTQKWTRVRTPPANAVPLPPINSTAVPPAKQLPAKKGVPPPAQAAAPSDTCLRVADEAAAAEKLRAKK